MSSTGLMTRVNSMAIPPPYVIGFSYRQSSALPKAVSSTVAWLSPQRPIPCAEVRRRFPILRTLAIVGQQLCQHDARELAFRIERNANSRVVEAQLAGVAHP